MSQDQIYNMVWEEDFAVFNKLYTTMCRFADNCTKSNCTFAHDKIKPAICVYHFSDGCTNTASQCKFSHSKTHAINAYNSYIKWIDTKPLIYQDSTEKQFMDMKRNEMEQILKEQDEAMQEFATVYFHENVVKPILDLENEMTSDMEEEDVLHQIEIEQELADEIESIHQDFSDDEYIEDDIESEIPDYETLVSMVVQQQQIINYMWCSMTTSQAAC